MFHDFMSVIQNLMAEITPSQECGMVMGPILNSYGAKSILHSVLGCIKLHPSGLRCYITFLAENGIGNNF